VLQIGGVTAVIATLVGAILATARPIAVPPPREYMNSLAPKRSELVEQRRAERQRTVEEQKENNSWQKVRKERRETRDASKPSQEEDDAGT
jgi:hypothetical protein